MANSDRLRGQTAIVTAPASAWHRDAAVGGRGPRHRVGPRLRRRNDGRRTRAIVPRRGRRNGCAYSAAKGGVIALTKSIARDLAGTDVLANCVAPSMVETDLLAEMTPDYIAAVKAKVPMGRLLQISELASMVAFAASPECSFTTGFTFDLIGGRANY